MDGSGQALELKFLQLIKHHLAGIQTLGAQLVFLLRFVNKKNPDAAPVPQPDNGEQRLKLLEKKEESCLALASGLWQDETVWNDIACYHPKEWICEDSDIFLAQAGLL